MSCSSYAKPLSFFPSEKYVLVTLNMNLLGNFPQPRLSEKKFPLDTFMIPTPSHI